MLIPESKERRHEVQDINVGRIVRLALFTSIVGIFILLGTWWLYRSFFSPETTPPSPFTPDVPLKFVYPQEPRLQVSPAQEYQAYAAKQFDQLNSYAWIDTPREVVRIPIERAIEILAREDERHFRTEP